LELLLLQWQMGWYCHCVRCTLCLWGGTGLG
jgi:hypothetical protein